MSGSRKIKSSAERWTVERHLSTYQLINLSTLPPSLPHLVDRPIQHELDVLTQGQPRTCLGMFCDYLIVFRGVERKDYAFGFRMFLDFRIDPLFFVLEEILPARKAGLFRVLR